ncbi:MAG: SBBP repeat-containing protein [Bacteroidetes bacterium]|nr:SBBP repeat-containing protein [Bacteroidota bacterium]
MKNSNFNTALKNILYISVLQSLLFVNYVGANTNLGKNTTEAKKQPAQSQRGNGLRFTPNKGQIADMNGKFRPDILYKANGGGSNIYLRETGLSYVFTNMGEVMHDAEEQAEKLKKEASAPLDQANEQHGKYEVIQKQTLKIHRIDMDFVNCLPTHPSSAILTNDITSEQAGNKNLTFVNEDEVEGYNNYYYGHCPMGVTHVKQYNKVTYTNIYNNIDVSYYGNQENGLKYNIIVKPNADANQIKLHWTGAEDIHINRAGNLVVKTSLNEFYESIPKVYQNINGKIIDIKTTYVLTRISAGEVIINFSFSIYNSSFPLVIDPWVSYYGGSDPDFGCSVTTDISGNVAFTGQTASVGLPVTVGAFQTVFGGGGVGIYDSFIVEMNSGGTMLWATYLGGSGSEGPTGVASDNFGNILVAGTTRSTNFPVGASAGNVLYQSATGGSSDAFLYKFSPAGLRLWGTYYGSTGGDSGYDVATDGSNIYLYGSTSSTTGISTAGAFQVALNGFGDVFLVKFTSIGNRTWGSYVGGSSGENWGNGGISYDTVTASIYLSGITTSANFPVSPGCHQPLFAGGFYDGFLFKFSSAGARLWATYYGGTAQEYYTCMNTCDGLGNVILSGVTNSMTGISSAGAYQVSNGGGGLNIDTYVVKFNSAGVRQWGTYLGGNVNEYVWGIATDGNNNIYIAGDFEDQGPGNYPISPCAYQTAFGGGPVNENEDQYIAKYDPGGKQRCITYMGGNLEDDADNYGNTITIDGNILYLTGFTHGNYPVTAGAFQTVFGGVVGTWGASDAFIRQLCINLCEAKVLGLNYSASATAVCVNAPVTFTPTVSNSCDTSGYKFQWTFTGGNPASSTAINPIVSYPIAGNYSVQLTLTTTCKKDSLIKTSYITVTSCGGITALATGASICSGACATVSASGSNGTLPYTYSWSNSATTQNINPCPSSTTAYTVTITDAGGNTAISTAAVTVNASVAITAAPTNITCNAGTDGSVIANPGGGTSPYTYNWSNGQTTQTATGLPAGNYSVTVTDSKGCTATSTTAIISPQPLAGQFTKGTANCTGCGCKEWIMVTGSGGTNPYNYAWPASGGYTNRYKNQLCPGAYSVNITDKNGCSINVNLTAP